MNIAEYNTYIEKYLKMVYRISFHYFRNPFRKRKTEIEEKELENIIGTSSSEQEIVNRKVVMDAVFSLYICLIIFNCNFVRKSIQYF